MSIGNNPAYPCEAQGDRSVPQEHDYIQTGIYTGKFPGLTIRDHIAIEALVGIGTWMPTASHAAVRDSDWALQLRAEWAYRQADAMLAARAGSRISPADLRVRAGQLLNDAGDGNDPLARLRRDAADHLAEAAHHLAKIDRLSRVGGQ